MEHEYDVLIIGGGVVGCAIARELAAYRLKIGVLEKNPDVGYETSARNTGVVHGGFAYDVGSLKAALCVEGNRMMGELAEELHFPFKRCGKILVGSTEEEYARLLEVIRQGEACGASNLRMVDREELHAILPSVEGNFALLSENSGIVDPFLMTSALAENAAENGVDFHLSCEVCDISREGPDQQRPRDRRGASALQRPADGPGPHRSHLRCDEGDPENESRSAPRIRNCPHPGCSWARKRCDHDENNPADHSRTVKECVLHLARHNRQSRSRRKKRHACFAPRETRSCKPASQRQFSSG